MKTIRKNGLKFLVLLLVAVFMSQTLCFSTGSAMAEVVSLASQNSQVMALADDVKELKTAQDFADWLTSGTHTNVILAGGAGTIYDLSTCTYSTKSSFSGTFDGNYCTIIGLSKPLFKSLTNAKIQNVYIGSGSITSSTESNMGAIAQEAKGATVIRNCINSATIKLTTVPNSTSVSLNVGGIVGHATGTTQIIECSNHADITAGNDATGATGATKAYAGGIVGYADGSTKVKDSYVAPLDVSDDINITAYAKIVKESATDLKKKNMPYNGLSHVTQKINEDWQKAKNDLAGYQKEASTLQKSIDSLKSQIRNLDNKIASIENTIKARTREADNSRFKWKWSYMWGVIAGLRAEQAALRVAQGALWVSVGAVEAARAVVYAAISTAQALLKVLNQFVSHIQYDNSVLQVTDKVTEQISKVDAYAYGIGYFVKPSSPRFADNKKIENSYTYNVNTIGGYYEQTYKYPLRFWSQNPWLGGVTTSSKFTFYVVLHEENNYGPITNNEKIVSGIYYYTAPETYQENRFIWVDDDNYNISKTNYSSNTNFYGLEKISVNRYRTWADFEKQKLIIATSGTNKDQITIYANNGRDFLDKWVSSYAGLGTVFDTRSFFHAIPTIVGNGNTDKITNNLNKSTIDNNITANGSSTIWGKSNLINNGYPYLKSRYWQES